MNQRCVFVMFCLSVVNVIDFGGDTTTARYNHCWWFFNYLLICFYLFSHLIRILCLLVYYQYWSVGECVEWVHCHCTCICFTGNVLVTHHQWRYSTVGLFVVAVVFCWPFFRSSMPNLTLLWRCSLYSLYTNCSSLLIKLVSNKYDALFLFTFSSAVVWRVLKLYVASRYVQRLVAMVTWKWLCTPLDCPRSHFARRYRYKMF